jgi:hypothetical protein
MSIFVYEVKGAAAQGQTDINKISETVLIPLFAEIYDYRNLKKLGDNYPGIDLGDDVARVAIQVTATTTNEKAKHTLSEFTKNELHKQYDRLIIYILTEKQRSYSDAKYSDIIQGKFVFDIRKDIQDYRDLLKVVSSFQVEKASTVLKILEINFGKEKREDLTSLRLRGQVPAQGLITRAKTRWNYQDIAVGVRLEEIESKGPSQKASHSISLDDLISNFREGFNLFLVGEAGVGKTTTLIALCEKLLADDSTPLPIFVDAATWASSERGLLDYIASFSSFSNANLKVEELSRLNEAGELLIVINGWNEISASKQADARERLRQFFTGSSKPKLAVATRWEADSLGIPDVKKVRVHGFTWDEQQAFIRRTLPEESAETLLNNLRTNSKLRSITKNPLVLNGVISLHKMGQAVPENLFDLLDAIVKVFEAEAARSIALKGAPLYGCHRQYLESIAEAMNRSGLILMPDTEARHIVQKTGLKLVDQGMLSEPIPQPSDILEELCSRHLLHRDEDSALRFAHQRFQEFFSASVVLSRLDKAVVKSDEGKVFQTEILNFPFWQDAVELAASKLVDDPSRRPQARRLINLALPVDLWYASQLAGMLKIGAEDEDTWQKLRDAIEQMHSHAGPEAKQYALHCAVATRSPEFTHLLWPLLESEDQQVRLTAYRLGGGLPLKQLGPDALDRMIKWADERRAESVRGFADRPENLQFIEQLAQSDPINSVRAAAIGTLDFYYLATDAALHAWLKAPDAVKEEKDALSFVLDLWSPDNIVLSHELLAFARRSTSDAVKRKVGLRLLGQAEEIGADAARAALQEQKIGRDSSTALITFLRTIDAGFLKNLIIERISKGGRIEDWMRQELTAYPERDSLVLMVLEELAVAEHSNFDASVAEGATESLVAQLLEEGLQLSSALRYGQRDEATSRRFRAIERLLAYVDASLLIQVVLRRIDACSYDDAAWLFEILDQRASTAEEGRGGMGEGTPWRPDTVKFDALITAVKGIRDTREVSDCKLEAHVVSLASKVNPERYFDSIIEGTKLFMQAYSAFEEALKRWVEHPEPSTRPWNPPYGRWFVQALLRCGFDAVPNLLKIAKDPGALHIVPEALVAICSVPWQRRREKSILFDNYVDGYQRHRSAGRVFRQPDEVHQAETDEIARLLVNQIEEMNTPGAKLYIADVFKPSMQAHLFWEMCKLLAHVPSSVGVPMLHTILLREDAQTYPYLAIAEGVISQGGTIPSDALKIIRSLWQREIDQKWYDDNSRSRLSMLAVLHFFIKTAEDGLAQLRELLPELIKRVSLWQVINVFAPIPTKEAMSVLTELLPRLEPQTNYENRILSAIASNPTPEASTVLLRLIETDAVLKYSQEIFREDTITRRLKESAINDPKFMQRLFAVLEAKTDARYEGLVAVVLREIDDPTARSLVCRYLDDQAYPQGGHTAAYVLMNQFSRETESEHGSGWREIHPQANAPLRRHLYMLASRPNPSRNRARKLLLDLEESRVERGRPVNETRHPAIETGSNWPLCMYSK